MSYELFQQGPEAYLPVLFVSLIVTVLAYGAFPFVFAKTRKAPITKKKYNRLCYGINFAVMFVFAIIGGTASVGPYILWTWVFTRYGAKILGLRDIMIDSDYLLADPNRVNECKSCGHRDKKFFNACPKCGQYAKQYVYLNNEEAASETDKIRFCRKCGEKLIDNSEFCRKCGTEIVEEPIVIIDEPENSEFCKRCGADISNDINTCHVCGESTIR